MNIETPQIQNVAYGNITSSYGPAWNDLGAAEPQAIREAKSNWHDIAMLASQSPAPTINLNLTKETMPNTQRRIVQVFIADPDPNVPLTDAVLHQTPSPFLTDSSDQELYFEIPITELLKVHNAKRAGWLDKKASKKAGKDIFLEPVKIRDLRMTVVTIAQF